MPKTTVEFNDRASAELDRLASLLQVKKADVLRSALSLYSFIVDELAASDRQLAILENDQVKKVVALHEIKRARELEHHGEPIRQRS